MSSFRSRDARDPSRCASSRRPPGLSRKRAAVGLASLLSLTAVALPASASAAQPPVGLGTADSFAVLAGSTVTNTGPSVLNGDLGVSPGTSLTGFGTAPDGTVNGTTHSGDAAAASAETALTNAITDAAGRTPASAVTADLGGQRLTPGVYNGPTLGLTGALTLDARGNANAVFIFQAGSTLTTAVGSSVILVNGAQACNVFWEIGSSATLGAASMFTGNILASASISLDNAVALNGRALASTGAVTLINDTVTAARCAAPVVTPPTSGGTAFTSGTPSPPVAVSTPTTPVAVSTPTTPVTVSTPTTPVTVNTPTAPAPVSTPSTPAKSNTTSAAKQRQFRADARAKARARARARARAKARAHRHVRPPLARAPISTGGFTG